MNQSTKSKVAEGLRRLADRMEGLGLLYSNPEITNHYRAMRDELKNFANLFHKEGKDGKKITKQKGKKRGRGRQRDSS